jgi:hypothetical protein
MRTPLLCVVVLALAAVAVRADDKPAAPAKGFELRILVVGEMYHGIRFKPATGESWQMLRGAWEKLEETAAPPAGDYDITIIPAEALLAVRVDRATGSTWLLQKGQWNRVKEPAADPKAPKPGPGFAVRYTLVTEQLHVVRFHTKTGAAWHIVGDEYEPLGELGNVPAGEFDLTLIAGKKDWMGFRIDKKAGATWILKANIWHKVTEPQ